LSTFQSAIYQQIIIMWIKAIDALDSTLTSLYNIIWGKCSKLMQNKLRSSKIFEEKDLRGNLVWLLKEIRPISHQLEANISLYDSVDEVKRSYCLYK